LNSTSNVNLNITAFDNGNTGSAARNVSDGLHDLIVAPVNDAPIIAAPASIAVTEDVASIISGISVSDVDSGAANTTLNLAIAPERSPPLTRAA